MQLDKKSNKSDLELTISRSNIVNAVTSFLIATSIINDDIEVEDIQFGDLSGTNDLVPIKIIYKKKSEVLKDNGKED